MANFVAICDGNPGRRKQFLDQVRGQLVIHPGMVPGEAEKGDFHLLWAVPGSSPAEVKKGGNALTARFGRTFDPGSGMEWTAADLHERIGRGMNPAGETGAADGFHAWISYSPDRGLAASTDFLGMFPLYHWSDSERVIIASSPALIVRLDEFRKEADPMGMMGILLTNGLVGGRTLWQGIRRLGAGATLSWRRGGDGVVETLRPFRVDSSLAREVAAGSREELADRYNGELERVVRGQFAGRPGQTEILLSGGLDSRLVLAWALEVGVPISGALSLGKSDDYDARCAKWVTERLGLPHRIVNAPETGLARDLGGVAVWEHLAGGATSATWTWFAAREAARSADRLLSGALLDSLLAPLKTRKIEDVGLPDATYCFNAIREWGLSGEELAELVVSETLAEAALWVDETVRRELREIEEEGLPLYWWHALINRGRFHVGSVFWSWGLQCEPLIPVFDRRLAVLAASSPMEWTIGRGIQDLMLARRFPELAEIPLDTNSPNPRYLVRPSKAVREAFARELADSPRLRAHRMLRTWARFLRLPEPREPERRHYFRVYGYRRHAGWRAERDAALRDVDLLPGFHPQKLRAFLCPGEELPESGQATVSRKNLVGLLRWAKAFQPEFPAPGAVVPGGQRPQTFATPFRWNVGTPEVTSSGTEHVVSIPIHCEPSFARVQYRLERFAPGAPVAEDLCLPLTLIPAMAGRVHTLALTEPLSPALLEASHRVQTIFSGWFPGFQPVKVEAPARPGSGGRFGADRGTAAFFSGGVDSCHTAITHRDEIDWLVYVHGLDVGIGDSARMELILPRLRRMAATLGKPLVVVTTDFRHFSDRYARWGHHFCGSGLATVGLLLGRWVRRIYIPSSFDGQSPPPVGSHPDLDVLWSTEDVAVLHDQVGVTRTEKTKALRLVPGLIPDLRVCYQNVGDAYNCGACEKCLRTMLDLELAGLADHPGLPFPGRLRSEWLDAITSDPDYGLPFWKHSLDNMRQQPVSSRLTAAVERLVARSAVLG